MRLVLAFGFLAATAAASDAPRGTLLSTLTGRIDDAAAADRDDDEFADVGATRRASPIKTSRVLINSDNETGTKLEYADGTLELRWDDQRKIAVQYPNGTQVEVQMFPNKYMGIDGDNRSHIPVITTIFPNTTRVSYYPASGIRKELSPDGRRVDSFADGTRIVFIAAEEAAEASAAAAKKKKKKRRGKRGGAAPIPAVEAPPAEEAVAEPTVEQHDDELSEEISALLRRLGLDERVGPVFAREKIDENALPFLTVEDLVEAGVAADDARKIVTDAAPADTAAEEPAPAAEDAPAPESKQIPERLCCPISLELMVRPVIAAEGTRMIGVVSRTGWPAATLRRLRLVRRSNTSTWRTTT